MSIHQPLNPRPSHTRLVTQVFVLRFYFVSKRPRLDGWSEFLLCTRRLNQSEITRQLITDLLDPLSLRSFFSFCIKTAVKDGGQTEDSHGERETQQEHHSERQCVQIYGNHRSDSYYSHSFDIYVINNRIYGFVCVILNAYFVYSCKIVCLIHSFNVHLITLSFFRSNLGLC